MLGQAVLPGVPVCHMVIRNKAFLRRAASVALQLVSIEISSVVDLWFMV